MPPFLGKGQVPKRDPSKWEPQYHMWFQYPKSSKPQVVIPKETPKSSKNIYLTSDFQSSFKVQPSPCTCPQNQPTNQPANQPTSQPTNQPTNQAANQPTLLGSTTSPSFEWILDGESTDNTSSWSMDHSSHQWPWRPAGRSWNEWSLLRTIECSTHFSCHKFFEVS